jgi:hypothetical protein
VTENRGVTVNSLIELLINMRDVQGWGDVEVAVSNGHDCRNPMAVTIAATYYPPASMAKLIDGHPVDRPVVVLLTERGRR